MKPVTIKIKGETVQMGRLVDRKQMTTIFGEKPDGTMIIPNYEFNFKEFHMNASRERHFHEKCTAWMIDYRLFHDKLVVNPDIHFIVIIDVSSGYFYKTRLQAWEDLGFKATKKYERSSFCLPITYFSVFNSKKEKVQDMHAKARRYICTI